MKSMFMLLACAATFAAGPAGASSPAEWEKLNRRVNRACIAMSGLERPQLLAKRIGFSDVIGIEIRQLRGVDKRGRTQRLLCAFNRATGRTEVQEADNWNGKTTTP